MRSLTCPNAIDLPGIDIPVIDRAGRGRRLVRTAAAWALIAFAPIAAGCDDDGMPNPDARDAPVGDAAGDALDARPDAGDAADAVDAPGDAPPPLDSAAETGDATDGADAVDAPAPEVSMPEVSDVNLNPDGLEQVRTIRGAPESTYIDVRFIGIELVNLDGVIVTARVGDPARPPERLATGQVVVAGGRFDLLFPQAHESGLFKPKFLYLDTNRNGQCDVGELAHVGHDPAINSVTYSLSPQDPSRLRPATTPVCAWLNMPWPAQ